MPAKREVTVFLQITAAVPEDYGNPELTDMVRWHLDLSTLRLDQLGFDPSAIEITAVRDVGLPADRNTDTVGRWLEQ